MPQEDKSALVPQTSTTPVSVHNKITETIREHTSQILANAQTHGPSGPTKLYEGYWEFQKAGYQITPSHLLVITLGDETLALLTGKPQIVSHREAAAQIARSMGADPRRFLYLHRVCAGPEGPNNGFCRDKIEMFAFDWEWARSSGMWIAASQTYCYRVSSQTETAIQTLLNLEQSPMNVNVVETTNVS